ncbi:MAG: amylo-alpha-1,6-glucosidase [Gemmatimonadales bacterium]
MSIDIHYPCEVLHEGYTVLVAERDSTVTGIEREGLFDYDTRILSRHRLTLNGQPLRYVAGKPLDACRWEGHLVLQRDGGTAEGPSLPQDTVEVIVTRRVGRGMAERITVTNHSMAPWEGVLGLEVDADFADLMALGDGASPPGTVRWSWDETDASLRFEYQASHNGHEIRRGLRVRTIDHVPVVDFDPGVILRFSLSLGPHEQWSVSLVYGSLVDGVWREPLSENNGSGTERDRLRARWEGHRTRLTASDPHLTAAFSQGAQDLLALRAWEFDLGPDAWFPNAGVPGYTGIFGRDILTAGWQSALLGPEMMRGGLGILARYQADFDSAWRDASPGKLPHEMRRGPQADLELIPHRAYYGEQTAPSMFVVVLSEYWHWTGDLDMLRRYRPVLDRLFEWARQYGDRDRDGFLEYDTRSPKGLKNQGWKDSEEAIRYPDGRMVPNPIATLEEQAFHFLALQRMAEILMVLDDEAGGERYLEQARDVARRVNDAYWLEDQQFYAEALDPEKQPVRSIASNPGHALATGLVPEERARLVADRLLSDELFSGWGVRTLSSKHPSYNPLAYHLGSVWPVENATFALGFKRYGLDDHVARVVTAQLEAAAALEPHRLPEALSGHSRSGQVLPAIYPRANAPQAWSASAIVLMVQALLGIFAFAPGNLLTLVRPRLPPWLDWIVLRDIRVGDAAVSLRFERRDDGSAAVDVLERHGTLFVLTVPPPRDLSPERASWLDHLKEWGLEHLPGRMARALRIAVGIEP